MEHGSPIWLTYGFIYLTAAVLAVPIARALGLDVAVTRHGRVNSLAEAAADELVARLGEACQGRIVWEAPE